jgi:hypothetical protein
MTCPPSGWAVDCRASMSSEHRSIPLRWILPAAQLLLCIAILWPLRGELISSVRSSTHSYLLHDEPAQALKSTFECFTRTYCRTSQIFTR